MANIYRGTLAPLLQGVTDRSSPSDGFVRELEYRGMSEAHARALFLQYIGAGFEAELQVRHGICTLIATDTSGAVTIDTWEIGANEVLASSLKNPRNFGIPANDLLILAYIQKDGLKKDDAIAAILEDTGQTVTWGGSAASQRLLERIKAGSDSYFTSQYVLRHTTNVSNRYDINISDVGVNMIYSTAELLSETQNANSWVYPLPGRLAYKINNIPVPSITPSNYQWGWLKSASTEATAANNRINIATEYKLFQWSTDEYAQF